MYTHVYCYYITCYITHYMLTITTLYYIYIGKELIKLLNHDSIKNIKLTTLSSSSTNQHPLTSSSAGTSSNTTSSGAVVVGVHDRPSNIVNNNTTANTTVIDIV